jgi:cytochrome bd-type quinol oxidase subunit 2
VTFADANSAVERARCWGSRAALISATILLIAGLFLAQLQHSQYTRVLEWACALLLSVPILNAVAALLEEIGRREWPFVGAALLVLALVAFSVVQRMQ